MVCVCVQMLVACVSAFTSVLETLSPALNQTGKKWHERGRKKESLCCVCCGGGEGGSTGIMSDSRHPATSDFD